MEGSKWAFVGRRNELDALAATASDVAQGRAAVAWVEGEAGLGKSALVRQAIGDLPAGFQVLSAEGDELATDVAFGVYTQLAALEGPEQVTTGAVATGLTAGLALLHLLGQRQDAGPVALVIEDLHWADLPSRQALLFAARRLERDRVLMIVTSRPDSSGAIGDDGWGRFRFDASRCQLVRLGPLGPGEVAELGRRTGNPLSFGDAERLCRHTAGHPLHIRTLLAELSAEQLSNPEGELPAPRSLGASTMARLVALPTHAQQLAGALAVIGHRTPLQVAGEVAQLARPTEALGPLLDAGLATSWPTEARTPVELTHPLYRVAIYEGLAPARRLALHQRAAAVLDPAAALAHQVAAAEGPDDRLAQELDEAALREERNEAAALAARYRLWASSLSSSREDAETRLLGAARLLLADGQLARAAALRARIAQCQSRPARDLVLGMLAWDEGDGPAAERWLRRAVDPGVHPEAPPEVLGTALARFGTVCAIQGRAAEGAEVARRALGLVGDRGPLASECWSAVAMATGMREGAPAALNELATRLPADPAAVAPVDVDLLILRGALGFYAGHTTAAVGDLKTAIRLVRHGALTTLLPRAHLHLAQLLPYLGELDEGLVHAHLALSLVAGDRQVWLESQVQAALVRVLAARGRWVEADEALAGARRLGTELATPEAVGGVLIAEATLARARGEPRRVVAALDPMARGAIPGGTMMSSLAWWPMLVVATLQCGDLSEAESLVDRFEQGARARGLDREADLVGLRARCAERRGRWDEAGDGFRSALALAGPDFPVLELGQLHQAFGRLLLARGQRREALDQLRSAHQVAVRVGAEPFRLQVDADIEACGIRAPRRQRSRLALTDRERDVVALVAKGWTNRDVAAELYVSVKAVEFHLRNVYGKLGVGSRRELQDRLANEVSAQRDGDAGRPQYSLS